ncbi:MAG: asparagine synthase (glutamine-hydrolyzing), partial [Flavobacterium sp.]|nr:asparagine synthase (glutamine-hydrolyzing) [Flavobacterium sp.]
MCGIAGLIVRNNTNFDIAGILHSMTSRISHRGPDSNGSWIDEGERVGLGHRRLSILDLSEAGSQPMISPNGRYVIVLNGEIYNFHEIRARLTVDFSNEIQFVGHSDTEILLNAIERYGVLETLKLAHGMFAFALWDKQEREIYFARDRFGEKPLYYGFCPEGLVFASELSCFKEFGRKYWEIDRDSLALFFRHNYIPAPYTIFKNVWKLRPGHLLKIHINSVVAGAIGDFVSAPYWSLLESARNAENTIERSPEIYENELEDLLRKAIGQQMIADVSLGAFLSGGVDSSLIVGIMQSISNVPVKTFTLGFNETGFDEAVYAKKIADHLGTSHSELYVTPRMALDLVPKMSQIYSEPFSDSSQIPTALICMQARKKVTVALSGDAGDELFGGYDRYFQSENFWKLHGMGGQRFNSFASRFFGVIGKALRAFPSFSYLNKITDKTQRISDFFLSKDFPGLYKLFVSHHKEPCSIVLRSMREPESMLDQIESFDFFHSNFER